MVLFAPLVGLWLAGRIDEHLNGEFRETVILTGTPHPVKSHLTVYNAIAYVDESVPEPAGLEI